MKIQKKHLHNLIPYETLQHHICIVIAQCTVILCCNPTVLTHKKINKEMM